MLVYNKQFIIHYARYEHLKYSNAFFYCVRRSFFKNTAWH